MNRVCSMLIVLCLMFSIANYAFPGEITECKIIGKDAVVYRDGPINIRIQGIADNILRITYSKRKEFLQSDSLMIVKHGKSAKLQLNKSVDTVTVTTPQISLTLNRKNGAMSF